MRDPEARSWGSTAMPPISHGWRRPSRARASPSRSVRPRLGRRSYEAGRLSGRANEAVARRRERPAVTGCKLQQRGLPGAAADSLEAGGRQPSPMPLAAGELDDRVGERPGIGRRKTARPAVFDQLARAARSNGDRRESARLRLLDDLAEGVSRAREDEEVGAGVDAGKVGALDPAEERRRVA